ncbi:MAG: DNA gyrase subunit A [Anaerolineales bacterium]
MTIGEIGLIQQVDIEHEMQQAYLDYAMSVIVARALPDARDGLKPVHRRILYAMHDLGLRANSAHKKSARIVGEVLGKYHPHGDMAVYDAMARMAQDFSMRYPLVDGQGNFGSIDGDAPAAMRYTEARLSALAHHMLNDIQKDTVDFSANFDDSLQEPDVLPAAFPNLLVNGATGIAVGMSTNIPPHNLDEISHALKYLLENWERLDDITVDDLMKFVKGPDFPTGGVIIQEAEGNTLSSAYGSGRGRVTLRARVHLEEMGRGRTGLIVTELPYMTNKSSLMERIASLVRDGRIEGISDLRDESDRQGMRIVIELGKNSDADDVLQTLYKQTSLQTTFSIIMLALVNGEPRLLSLKQAMRVYLEHRLEVTRRRSEYDLKRARERAHILEGLRIALANLDEVIATIRRSRSVETAYNNLRKAYRLSDVQTQAILAMPLRRLAALERQKIEQEYKDVRAEIKNLEKLLHSPRLMRGVVADELDAIRQQFGDHRRTQIVQLEEGTLASSVLTVTDMLPSQPVWVMISEEGMIARTRDEKPPRRSGSAAPRFLLQSNTHHTLYLSTPNGQSVAVAIHTLPVGENPEEGIPLAQVHALFAGNPLATAVCLPALDELPDEAGFVISVSRQGMLKKSALSDLPGPSPQPFALTRINAGDTLHSVCFSQGQNEILLVTTRGMAIRFSEEEVRPMGLVAAGVMGIKLEEGDEIAAALLLPAQGDVFLLTADGRGKRVAVEDFPQQGRYGKGVIAWKVPAKTGLIGAALGKPNVQVIAHLKKLTAKSLRLDSAPLQGRSARGAQVLMLKSGDVITHLTVPFSAPAFKRRS